MPFTLTMPKLSPTMEEGAIAKWHKKEGDYVEAGELLLEVATDKATVEHNALDGGWLRKIIVPEGGEAVVNQPIAIFTEEKEEKIDGYAPEGAEVRTKASIVEEPEKKAASLTLGKVLSKSGSLPPPAFAPEPPLENYQFPYPRGSQEGGIAASPLAKQLAKERGLDLSSVKGSGPGGYVVSRDLEQAQAVGKFTLHNLEKPTEIPGSFEEQSLTPMRKAIARRLQESKSFVPHFYVRQTINAEPLTALHLQLRELGFKLTYNDSLVRASALALRDHPEINCGFHAAEEKIIQFKTIDIGIAVSLKEGLITPIVRHADYKNLTEISVEVRALAKRAREGKLQLEEYKGGSFTISNLGMYNVTELQDIINPPQAAILAVSGIRAVPVVHSGVVVPGKEMNLTLSVDHRVIDGVAAAQFLKTLQKLLENPVALIL